MKKLFVLMFVAMLGMSAQAQEKGDFAVGLRAGATFTKLEIDDWKVDETTTQFGIGAFGQYSLTNHWRFELEGVYHPKKDHVSDFVVGLNVHYLFNLGENLKIYPILGYALAFVNTETFTESNRGSSVTVEGDNTTDGGIQLGVGLQANLGGNWFVSGEYMYQPGIFGDSHVTMAGVGYRF